MAKTNYRQHDVLYSISLCFYVTRILGLLPCCIVKRETTRILTISKSWLVYSVILSVFIFGGSLACVYTEQIQSLSNGIDFAGATGILYEVLNELTFLFIVVFSIKELRAFVSTVNMIRNLDLKWNRKEHVNTVVFRKSSTITGIILMILTVKTCIEIPLNWSSFWILLAMIPFIEILHALRFVNLCYVVREMFAELTEELSRHLTKNHSWTQRIELRHLELDDIPRVNRISVQNTRNHVWDAELAYSVLEMEELRHAYDILCDIVDKINSVFGFRLLVTIAHKFCEIVQDLFSLTILLDSLNKSKYPLIIILYEAIFFSAVVVILIRPCVSAVTQAEQVGVIIQKLQNRKLDAEVKEELQLFLTLVQQRKISFNACGFFTLDFTLLYTMAGAVTTYLVILVQFQISNKSSDSACDCSSGATQTTYPNLVTNGTEGYRL